MNASAKMQIQDYAFTQWPRLNQKARIWKLKRLLGWTERRTKAVYYNERGIRVTASEMAEIEALKKQEAKDEFKELRQRLARLEKALATQSEALHRP